jgi:hypothetical protein
MAKVYILGYGGTLLIISKEPWSSVGAVTMKPGLSPKRLIAIWKGYFATKWALPVAYSNIHIHTYIHAVFFLS